MARTENLTEIRARLEAEREWSAFALADLSPEHSRYCDWHLTGDGAGLVLIYRGFSPPLFFSLGPAESVGPLVREIAEAELYVSVRDGFLGELGAAGYRFHDHKTLYRMVLRRDMALATDVRAERLGAEHYDELVRLFEDGDATGERPAFFQERSLRTGVYFGVRDHGMLAAAAGTLVFAPEQSVACLGNVYTRRDYRGRGLATVVTAAVTRDLAQQGIRTIALNVVTDNLPAIQVYERLGFSRYCEYQEARAIHGRTVTL